jgi:hypothetical protein
MKLTQKVIKVTRGLRGHQEMLGLPVYGVHIRILGGVDTDTPLCSKTSTTTPGVIPIKLPPQIS